MNRVNLIIIGLVTALILGPVKTREMSHRLTKINPGNDVAKWKSRDLTDHMRRSLMDPEANDPRGQIQYDRSTFVCGENCAEIHSWDRYDEHNKPTIFQCDAFDVYGVPSLMPVELPVPCRQAQTILIHLGTQKIRNNFEDFLDEWGLKSRVNFNTQDFRDGLMMMHDPRRCDYMLTYRLANTFISKYDVLGPYLNMDWLKLWCIILEKKGDEKFQNGKRVVIPKTIVQIRPDLEISRPLNLISKLHKTENEYWKNFDEDYIEHQHEYELERMGNRDGIDQIGNKLDARPGSIWHPYQIYTKLEDREHVEKYLLADVDRYMDPRKKAFRKNYTESGDSKYQILTIGEKAMRLEAEIEQLKISEQGRGRRPRSKNANPDLESNILDKEKEGSIPDPELDQQNISMQDEPIQENQEAKEAQEPVKTDTAPKPNYKINRDKPVMSKKKTSNVEKWVSESDFDERGSVLSGARGSIISNLTRTSKYSGKRKPPATKICLAGMSEGRRELMNNAKACEKLRLWANTNMVDDREYDIQSIISAPAGYNRFLETDKNARNLGGRTERAMKKAKPRYTGSEIEFQDYHVTSKFQELTRNDLLPNGKERGKCNSTILPSAGADIGALNRIKQIAISNEYNMYCSITSMENTVKRYYLKSDKTIEPLKDAMSIELSPVPTDHLGKRSFEDTGLTPNQNISKRQSADNSIVSDGARLEPMGRTRKMSAARYANYKHAEPETHFPKHNYLGDSIRMRNYKPRRSKRPRRRPKVLKKDQNLRRNRKEMILAKIRKRELDALTPFFCNQNQFCKNFEINTVLHESIYHIKLGCKCRKILLKSTFSYTITRETVINLLIKINQKIPREKKFLSHGK